MATNFNFLNPVEFHFTVNRLPNVEFYIQSVSLPDISSGFTTQVTPFKTLYSHGDKLEFGDLQMTVIVDENLSSYLDVWQWLIALTKPEGFDQYATLASSDLGLYSDATLTIMNSNKNANIEVRFKDMFPVSVGNIDLATTQTDVTPPTVAMTFKYSSYDISVKGA